MEIYGIDFTSAPSSRKPIVCVGGDCDGKSMRLHTIERLTSFPAFERWLAARADCVMGFDFPFGQPRALIEALGWGTTWADYVARVEAMGVSGFIDAVRAYSDAQPPGKKHLRRRCDARGNAISPMMVYGVPIGRMFVQGAPRLLAAGVNVPPCRPTDDPRTTLEVYPALIARRIISRTSYKSDTPSKQSAAHRAARESIVAGLGRIAYVEYAVRLDLSDDLAQACIDDAHGETIDAALCALQAAWASAQPNYGIPPDADALEGWISDPLLGG